MMNIHINGKRCKGGARKDVDMKWGVIWSAECFCCKCYLSGKKIDPTIILEKLGWDIIDGFIYCNDCIDKIKGN